MDGGVYKLGLILNLSKLEPSLGILAGSRHGLGLVFVLNAEEKDGLACSTAPRQAVQFRRT